MPSLFKDLVYFKTLFSFQKVYSHSVVTACSLKVSVNSIAQCEDPTVIGTFAIILFAMITVCSLEIQLALLKPLANFFTAILFYSHAFQFVYNLEKIPKTIRSHSCSIF